VALIYLVRKKTKAGALKGVFLVTTAVKVSQGEAQEESRVNFVGFERSTFQSQTASSKRERKGRGGHDTLEGCGQARNANPPQRGCIGTNSFEPRHSDRAKMETMVELRTNQERTVLGRSTGVPFDARPGSGTNALAIDKRTGAFFSVNLDAVVGDRTPGWGGLSGQAEMVVRFETFQRAKRGEKSSS